MQFVVYEDNKEFIKKIENIIKNLKIEANINVYSDYTKELENTIKNSAKPKIYILDIELPNNISGIELAKIIRRKDWNSIIIILTSHTEMGYEALKAQIMVLDFLSKYESWEEKLKETLEKAIHNIGKSKMLVLETNDITYKIHTDDILYILRDSVERKCIIKTFYDEILSTKNISDFKFLEEDDFFQTHRSCFINVNNVKKVVWKENKIVFINEEEIDYLSRDRKKGLKKVCGNLFIL
jgi:two-component system response regulator AgrA